MFSKKKRLLKAIGKGRTEQVAALLRGGADPNGQEFLGYSWVHPLELAARTGSLEMVSRLLRAGANPNVGLPNATPLHVAVRSGSLPVVEALIGSGANVNASATLRSDRGTRDYEKGWTPLFIAAKKCTSYSRPNESGPHERLEILRALVRNGADVNASDERGETPLHIAAFSIPDPSAAKLLLDLGAGANARDRRGRTPLHGARSDEVIRLLVNRGADINARTEHGDTPLDYAAFSMGAAGADTLEELGGKTGSSLDLQQKAVSPKLVSADAASRIIASKISSLEGLDFEVASRFLRAAEEIIPKFFQFPPGTSDYFEKGTIEGFLSVYKIVLAHLFFTLFLGDHLGRQDVFTLVTEITDENSKHTAQLWDALEKATGVGSRENGPRETERVQEAAKQVWREISSILGMDDPPSVLESLTAIAFAEPWDAAIREVSPLFTGRLKPE